MTRYLAKFVLTILALLVSSRGLTVEAKGPAPRVAVVDMGKIYTAVTESQSFENELQTQLNEIQRLQNQIVFLSKKGDVQSLSQLNQYNAVLAKKQDEFLETSTKRRGQLFASLKIQVSQIIQDLAQQKGFDIVLQDAIYVSPAYDLTPQVMEVLTVPKN